MNVTYDFGKVTVLSIILRTTRCSSSSFSVASTFSAHLSSETGKPDITVHTYIFFGENALDNVSAITWYFPGVYSSATSYFAVTSVAHHRAVSSIS